MNSWTYRLAGLAVSVCVVSSGCGGDDGGREGSSGAGGATCNGAGGSGTDAAAGGAVEEASAPAVDAAREAVPDGGVADGGDAGDAPEPEPELPACLTGNLASGEPKERVALDAVIAADLELSSEVVYQINGVVRVASGATLTIPPCTRLEGSRDPSGVLVVGNGGRLVAEGTAEEPILFTSPEVPGVRRPGDWGGVLVLGGAPHEAADPRVEAFEDLPEYHYAGTDEADSSGTLSYVRIEFAGREIAPGIEPAALFLGAAGTGTTVSHVQAAHVKGDCFELSGGTAAVDHLVCNGDGDDLFDFRDGYRGSAEYLFGRKLRDPSDDPNGIELEGPRTGETDGGAIPRATLSHVTVCGYGFEVPAYSNAVVLGDAHATMDDVIAVEFDYGVDTRGASGTKSTPGSTLSHAAFADLRLGVSDNAEPDDDEQFDEFAWFNAGSGNGVESPGFSIEECAPSPGGSPRASVRNSGKGAFTGGGDWIRGAWVSFRRD